MASPRAVAVKMAGAVASIEKASAALAEKFGVEFAPLPSTTKVDPEFARASQLEHLGSFLQSIALASKSAKESDFAPPEQGTEQPAPVVEVPETVVEAAEAVEEPKRSKTSGRTKGKGK
jgi:hypothetical protein